MAHVDAQSLHLLSIDLGSASSSLRAVLELGAEDVDHWLSRAQAAGVPLVIVASPTSVDLYSSEAGRRVAFKPLLESLWSLARNLGGFDRVRTIEGTGHAAVRHLLRQAAGLDSAESGLSYRECIAAACERAEHHGTLTDLLRELFQTASTTAARIHAETELSAPHSTRASRQVEMLGAERIVEEELTALRVTSSHEIRASVAPAEASSRQSSLYPPYGADEPISSVRIRISPAGLGLLQRRSG